MVSEHRQFAVRVARPEFLWLVTIQFHSIIIRITQINRLAHTVVRRAFERNSRGQHSSQSCGESRTRGINDGGVIEPGRALGRRRTAKAFPSIQGNVMMVASRRKKNRAIAEPLHDLESKNTAVKSE